MWFAYTDNFANWHVLSIEQVKEIMAENKQNKKVSSLEDFAIETVSEPEKDFNNAMGQESLTRFDQPKKSKNKNRNKNKTKVSNPIEAKPNRTQSNQNQNQGQNPPEPKANGANPNQNKKPKQQDKKPIIIKKNENKE